MQPHGMPPHPGGFAAQRVKAVTPASPTPCPSGTSLRGVEIVPQNAERGPGRSAGAQHSSSDGKHLPQHLPCPSAAFQPLPESHPCGTVPLA